MKKHIISAVAIVAVFVMMFVWTACCERIIKERPELELTDEYADSYEYYKNLYKFNDDYDGDGIVSEDEQWMMYIRSYHVNEGLYKLGEKYLGDYGDCVYRYSLVWAEGIPEASYCIRVELNKNKTSGKAIIITNTNESDEDFNSYYTVTQKYMNKETVNSFLRLADGYGIEDRAIYEENVGDDGAYYGIEKYERGKYYYITRWTDMEEDTEKYMNDIMAFFSMID